MTAKKLGEHAHPVPDKIAALGDQPAGAQLLDNQDKGYIGIKADPLPNSAHSLASGPDGVPAIVAAPNPLGGVPDPDQVPHATEAVKADG